MNGSKVEIHWNQGSAEHDVWAADDQAAKVVLEALKLHPSVESVRIVGLVAEWSRAGVEAEAKRRKIVADLERAQEDVRHLESIVAEVARVAAYSDVSDLRDVLTKAGVAWRPSDVGEDRAPSAVQDPRPGPDEPQGSPS